MTLLALAACGMPALAPQLLSAAAPAQQFAGGGVPTLRAETMDQQQSFTFAPIGHIESCFRRLRGIPRQGALAPATKARLVLQRSVQAETADELERFSHLWVVFVFHDNTGTESKQRPGHQAYRAKIAPPKLGRRVGVFSTRSPHRPNSIGQTVVRYDGLAKFQLPPSPQYNKPRFGYALNLSGVDFVDGTPVLDIKPYVPAYDSVPMATMAPWVEQKAASDTALDGAAGGVTFSDEARGQLAAQLGLMRFYSSVERAEEAVRQVLSLDIHDGGRYTLYPISLIISRPWRAFRLILRSTVAQVRGRGSRSAARRSMLKSFAFRLTAWSL